MPNPHPFLTHFPIALLTVGFCFELAAVLRRGAEFSRFGWWNQLLGTIGLAATVVTGLLAEARTTIGPEAQHAFETHEQLAFFSATVFAILLFWRISCRTRLPEKNGRLFLLLFGAGIIALWAGAWYGGDIVYTFGVGVGGARGPG